MNDHIYIYCDDVPLTNDTKVLHRQDVSERKKGKKLNRKKGKAEKKDDEELDF